MANKKIIKKQSPMKYDLGDFVTRNQQPINASLTGAASLGAMTGNEAISGVTSGLASGAALGTAIMPGIGTAIGAVGGAIFGGIFGGKKAKKQKQERIRQEGIRRNQVYDQFESDINTVNENPYGVYANGGDIISNIINIEKGELQIDPNNGKILRKYSGINPETGGKYEPHAKKGKDSTNNMVSAEEGTFIITKKEAKKYEDAVDNNDKLAQNTIMSNIRNKKTQMTKYADGGTVNATKWMRDRAVQVAWNPLGDRLAVDGIYNPAPVMLGSIANNRNSGSYNLWDAPAMTRGRIPTADTTSSTVINNGVNNSVSSNKNNKNSFDFSGALDYLPIAANAIQGFQTPNYLQYRNVRPDVRNRQQVLNNMPNEISVNPVLNNIIGNSSANSRAIYQNTSNSAIARALNQANTDATNRAINDAYYQNNNLNNSIRGQRAGIYSNLAQSQENINAQNAQMQLNVDNVNRDMDLAKQQQLNYALSQLSQLNQAKRTNKQKSQREQQTLDLLREIFPNAGYLFDQYKGGKNGK